jgi:hypothetical protein
MFENKDTKVCIVCKGNIPSWTSGTEGGTTAKTDWGSFTVYYHKVCYDPTVVEKELRKIAEEAKPR